MCNRTALALILCGLAQGCQAGPETYAADCATPPSHWGREKDGIGHLRDVQPIYIGGDGSILFNNDAITDETLGRNMMKMSAWKPEPQVVLDVAPSASCERVEKVRAIMDASPLCKGSPSF